MEDTEGQQLINDVFDPNPSPLSSVESTTTPDTVFSPLESPFQKTLGFKDARSVARHKLSLLSLEEKVRVHLSTS